MMAMFSPPMNNIDVHKCLDPEMKDDFMFSCLRVDSSSHQGKWVSAIALLAACPTMVRTAGAAKRCRTTTDNFNLSLIIFFKFYHSFNVKMKSFLTSSSNWPIVNPSWNNIQHQMRHNIKIAFVPPDHLPKFLLQ